MKKFLAALVVLALAGCSDPVDQAAKKNIFSPENPPKVIAARNEKLPPENLADNPELARRVLQMGVAEVTERIGAHQYQAQVSFEWTGANGRVALTEKRQLTAGQGGVSGDFHGVSENTRDQGMEVYRVNGQVFARGRYGKFRERKRDRGMSERAREEFHGALRDFDAIFDGRLKLTPEGTATREGRTVWKYQVSLGPAVELAKAGPELPAVTLAKGGPDVGTKNRAAFANGRELKSVTGTILVDADESVVLSAKLDGRISMPAVEGNKPAELKLTLDSNITGVGQAVAIAAPKEFLPDQDKPKGIADALERFGMAKSKDGAADDEPDDDEAQN